MMFDALVLSIAAFATLAWGGNEPWAFALVAIATTALLAARALQGLWRGGRRISAAPVGVPCILFLAWVALQWLFWSVEPHTTRLYLLLALSSVGLLGLAASGSRARSDLRRLVVAVAVLGAFEAAYGLVQYLGGCEYIWNYRRISSQGVATGTLINRNHYALLMNLFLASTAGYLYYRTERILQGEAFSPIRLVRLPGSGNLLWILLWIVLMGLAVVGSLSRTGIAAMFCSILAMMLAARTMHSKRRGAVFGGALVSGILVLAAYTGIDEVLARYESLPAQWQSDRDRPALWRDAWPMARKRLAFGSGLGTFRWTYPAYETVQPDVPARYAHNDYLQAVAETGVAGLGLLLWAFAALGREAYRNFRYSRDPLVRGIGLGTIGWMAAMAVQEMTDFGMYIPGVVLMAAFVAGLNLRARRMDPLAVAPASGAGHSGAGSHRREF